MKPSTLLCAAALGALFSIAMPGVASNQSDAAGPGAGLVVSRGNPLAQPVQPRLQNEEKLLLIELADLKLRALPRNLALPAVERLLGELQMDAKIGGRLMKRFWVVRFPGLKTRAELDALVSRLEQNTAVLSVSQNFVVQPHRFNDPGFTAQRSLYNGTNTGKPDTYNSEFVKLIERVPGAAQSVVRIAVLDSGVAPSVDLDGQFDVQANFVEGVPYSETEERFVLDAQKFASAREPSTDGPNGAEPFYHGSKVQSLINAVANNSSGIVGVDQTISISQIRVLRDSGGGSLSSMFGVAWAVNMYDKVIEEELNDPNYAFFARLPANTSPAQVINMSLGGPRACSQFEQAVFDLVHNNTNVLVVASSGNDGLFGSTRVSSAPANCRGVISVGASNTQFGSAGYSNVSPALVTSTLGGDVLQGDSLPVTDPSLMRSSAGVSTAQGTSFSAPLVSAVLGTAIKMGLVANSTRASLTETLRTTGVDYRGANDFCGSRTDPATNTRPCGTILSTRAFLLAATGQDINTQQPTEPAPEPSEPPKQPPESNEPPPPPQQPPTETVDSGQPGAPQDPNPSESKTVEFAGTVRNVDPLSVLFTAENASVDAGTYSASFDSQTGQFVLAISIPGNYRLQFDAEPAGTAQSNDARTSSSRKTAFVSQVVLAADTRQITASDPMPANARGTPTSPSEGAPGVAPSGGGGGGGGALGLFGLLGLGLLVWVNRRGTQRAGF